MFTCSRKLRILFFNRKACERPAGCSRSSEEWKLWPLNRHNMSFKRTVHHFINCQWLCSLSVAQTRRNRCLTINEHVLYDRWWILYAFLQLKLDKYQLPLTIRSVESKLDSRHSHPNLPFVPDLFHVCVQKQNAPTRNNRRLTQSLILGTNNSLHRSRRFVPLLSILCHYKTRKQDT